VIAERLQALGDHYRTGGRIHGQQFGDGWLEGIQLGGPPTADGCCGRRVQVFADGLPRQVQMPGQLAQGPLLTPVESVNGVDLFRTQHMAVILLWGQSGEATTGLVLLA